MLNRQVGAAVVLGLAASVAVSPPAISKTTYKACVKKKTGEVRFLLGKKATKKCKKGWKKTTWTKSGPKGKTGSPGGQGAPGAGSTLGTVFDGNGQLIGDFLGPRLEFPGYFTVAIEGGTYMYSTWGQVRPFDLPPTYANNACTGVAFITLNSGWSITESVAADRAFRSVYRQTSPTLGPVSAYKLTGTWTSVVGQTYYQRNASGVCTAQAAFTGDVLPLVEVTAPQDRPGPLTIK